MKLLGRRDFCFWLVPPDEGKVRKVRLSARFMILLLFTISAVAGGFIFVASDYARVQVLRARNFLHLQLIQEERDKLITSNVSLASQLKDLQTVNSQVLSYEKQVKQRMDELSAILQSANPHGLREPAPLAVQPEAERTDYGIGGPEKACKERIFKNGKRISCPSQSRAGLEPSSLIPDGQNRASLNTALLTAPGLLGDIPQEGGLIAVLDRYIELLRVVPLGSPTIGHVNSSYGARVSPFGEGWAMHEGIDYSAPRGSPVVATGDGVVREVKRYSTYGWLIEINHNGTILSRYAHLSQTLVKPGERVCRGKTIGLVGSTGRSTGPHLHYEVLLNGKAQNPVRYVELASRLSRIFG